MTNVEQKSNLASKNCFPTLEHRQEILDFPSVSHDNKIKKELGYGHFVPKIQAHCHKNLCISHFFKNGNSYHYATIDASLENIFDANYCSLEKYDMIQLTTANFPYCMDSCLLISEPEREKFHNLYKYIPNSNLQCVHVHNSFGYFEPTIAGYVPYDSCGKRCEEFAKPLSYSTEEYLEQFFSNILQLLDYNSKNSLCQCYWPHRSQTSKKISDLVFDILSQEMLKGVEKAKPKPGHGNSFVSEKNFPYYKFSWLLESLNRANVHNAVNKHGEELFEAAKLKFLTRLLTTSFFYSDYKKLLELIKNKQIPNGEFIIEHSRYKWDAYLDTEPGWSWTWHASEIPEEEWSAEPSFLCEMLPDYVPVSELTETIFPDYETITDQLAEIQPLFIQLYTKCLKYHPSTNVYQELIDLYLDQGNYTEAMQTLKKAIDFDPNNKKLTTQRDQLLGSNKYIKDCLKKGISAGLSFEKGLTLGLIKGGWNGLINFIPDLLALPLNIFHLGMKISPLIMDPTGEGLIAAAKIVEMGEFVKEHLSKEVIVDLYDTIIEKINDCPVEKRGEYLGYAIGYVIVNIFSIAGATKGIKYLTKAQKIQGVISRLTKAKSAEIVEAAIIASKEREILKAGCKLQKDHQLKHYVEKGAKKIKKSVMHWDLEKIKAEMHPILGEGVPLGGKKFGEVGYREIVKFEEVCGETLINGEYVPTCFAKVYYKKNGEYHIVPFQPKDPSAPIWNKLYGKNKITKK